MTDQLNWSWTKRGNLVLRGQDGVVLAGVVPVGDRFKYVLVGKDGVWPWYESSPVYETAEACAAGALDAMGVA